MTTVYEAINLAADHIERNPSQFDFHAAITPNGPGCGAPGCAIGWTIHFMGETHHRFDSFAEESLLAGGDQCAFYKKMHDLEGDWTRDAIICSVALRKYADKYLGHEKPKRDLIPTSVREIFSRTYTAKDLTV